MNEEEIDASARPRESPERPERTFREVVERLLAERTDDPGFADDLEDIQASQPPMEGEDPWAS